MAARRPKKQRAEPSGVEGALNPAQGKAADIHDGPVLVIAGAGTGKTRTLVHRLVRLVKAGVPADSILLLTFTRRASQEMIGRAAALLGEQCWKVSGGTFHSFANAVLRRYGRAIDVPGDFTVLDQADTFEILSSIRSDLKLAERGRGFPRRQTIAAILSKATNKKVKIKQVLKEEYPQFLREEAHLAKIAKLYKAYKAERRLLDFDDLLVHLVRLLEESPEARQRIRERYRYVMVDEYQDTNLLQARITCQLAGEQQNLMVVGDDAQSIYAFRGAWYRNLLDFRKAFPDAPLVTLEQNYRSTQPILDVSNALMKQMSKAFHKRLLTCREGGERPLLVEASDEEEQASFVAAEVKRLRQAGIPLSEIAVLFRAGSHALALELELERSKIPYVKYGGFRFLEAAHIKDALAHLRVVSNPADDLSLVRVLMLCEGIGRTGALKMQRELAGKPVAEGLKEYPARKKSLHSLHELAGLLETLERARPTPARSLEHVLEYYAPILKLRFDDWPKRQRDLEQLVALCQRYESLESMLAELAIEPPNRSRKDNLTDDGAKDELVLSTMHSAKGLEWKVVFIIQAIDGCIPMRSTFDDLEPDQEKLDEELRLLYVAVTRAKDRLCIVWPRETARSYWSGWSSETPFIRAMPKNLLERCRASQRLRKSGRAPSRKARPKA